MLVRITNSPLDYAWGSETLIADLEGRAPSGRPEAEVWFGDHPGAPADVQDGSGRTLDRWLDDERGGIRLPFLLKLLAAAHPLSIQAHPSKEQAEEGFAREDAAGIPRDAGHRNYRDDNHKPELIVAVSDTFRALAGLRDVDGSLRLLAALGDGPGLRMLRDRLHRTDAAAALADVVPWLLSAEGAPAVGDVIAALPSADSDEFAAELELGRALCIETPGDPGIAVALLMNRVTLRRGEALYVPAGVLHAYYEGLGVEIMAASDNVLRGGLTPKHIDVAELSRVLDAAPGALAIAQPRGVDDALGDVAAYATPAPDFELLRVRVSDSAPAEVRPRGVAIALATSGDLELADGAGASPLRPGAAVLLVPGDGPVRVTGSGELFIAQPGVRPAS